MTYFKIKEYEKAVSELKIAIDLSNRRPVVVSVLGAVYAKQGKLNEEIIILAELETPPLIMISFMLLPS